MSLRLPLGHSDYRKIRRAGLHMVDKTPFIRHVLDSWAEVQLVCRPRRFGKSTNLSMLRYFLEAPQPGATDRGDDLFEGTRIWADLDARTHFQAHPVVYVSLKEARGRDWPETLQRLALVVAELAARPDILPASLTVVERDLLGRLVAREAAPAELAAGLALVVRAVAISRGQPVVLLVDEYDTPIHAAWARGELEPATLFFRGFFGAALKDNPNLSRAVLTGVLRVAQESIFSDLNNVAAATVLDAAFADDFGFTPADVAALVGGDDARLAELASWYDGYRVGGVTLYNPWSITSALANPGEPLRPYWVGTGGTELLDRIATRSPPELAAAVGELLQGASVTAQTLAGVSLREVEAQRDGLLNVLLHAGYLTARATEAGASGATAELCVPNLEVMQAFRSRVNVWVPAESVAGPLPARVVAAALSGDAAALENSLGELVLALLSWHDLADDTPERVYHAFVLGLLAHAPVGYRVQSNREFGDGRPDVVLLPSDPAAPAAIFEFKRAEGREGAEGAARRAAEQVVARRYAEGVAASRVWAWAVGFAGKRVVVRGV